MHIEYEIRVLEVDKSKIIEKLELLGAKKVGDWYQRRYVYDFNPKRKDEWIRLRTNGETVTLAYKNVEENTVDGTKELEIKVSDFEETNEMLNILGYTPKGYQENKRIRYMLDNVEIDIDSWPMIPTYMEIEGESEKEVENVLNRLDVNRDKVTALNCQDIYKSYGIDIDEIKELKF